MLAKFNNGPTITVTIIVTGSTVLDSLLVVNVRTVSCSLELGNNRHAMRSHCDESHSSLQVRLALPYIYDTRYTLYVCKVRCELSR